MLERVVLTEAERQAVHAFLAENWRQFEGVAADFMTADEVDELAEKLKDG